MRWKPGRGKGQIEDRRGGGGSRGMGLPIGVGGGGLGIVGIIIAVLVMSGALGDGSGMPGIDLPGMQAAEGQPLEGPDPDARLKDFVGFVVADVQDSWSQSFAAGGREYERTTLVLFDESVRSGCGPASSATGPFYCPADRKVYLDLEFFRELDRRFEAPGDFAQAYVIAHEFGHHVQNVLGIMGEVRQLEQENPEEANEYSILLELQADCLAGVWAHTAYEDDLLESGDLEEGLRAAAAVGDDRIQEQATGSVNPETWTHGSSEQRTTWFRRGFDEGDPSACDTFAA